MSRVKNMFQSYMGKDRNKITENHEINSNGRKQQLFVMYDVNVDNDVAKVMIPKKSSSSFEETLQEIPSDISYGDFMSIVENFSGKLRGV